MSTQVDGPSTGAHSQRRRECPERREAARWPGRPLEDNEASSCETEAVVVFESSRHAQRVSDLPDGPTAPAPAAAGRPGGAGGAALDLHEGIDTPRVADAPLGHNGEPPDPSSTGGCQRWPE